MRKRANAAKASQGKPQVARSAIIAVGLIIAAVVALKTLDYFAPGVMNGLQAAVAEYGLFGNFVAILLGSMLLPFPTDAFFTSTVALSSEPVQLTIVAVVAAFIGGMVNYALAFFLSEKWVAKQVGKPVLDEAKSWFDAYGPWAIIIFGVLPLSAVIDPLTFVAGLARMDALKFAAWSLAARIIHFTAITIIAKGVIGL
ncbi:MAG: VTT domain-containing protein [Candidatus Micrarchaeota archaeon]